MTDFSPYIFLPISYIHRSEFKENEFVFSRIINDRTEEIHFINLKICGIIVEKGENELIIDDGSGQLSVIFSECSSQTIPSLGNYCVLRGNLLNHSKNYKMQLHSCLIYQDGINEIECLLILAAKSRSPEEYNDFMKVPGSEQLEEEKMHLSQIVNQILQELEDNENISVAKVKEICYSNEMYQTVIAELSDEMYQDGDSIPSFFSENLDITTLNKKCQEAILTKEYCPFYQRINLSSSTFLDPLLIHPTHPEFNQEFEVVKSFFSQSPNSSSFQVPIIFFLESIDNPVPFIPLNFSLIVNHTKFTLPVNCSQRSKRFWINIYPALNKGKNSIHFTSNQTSGSSFIFVCSLFHPFSQHQFSTRLINFPHLGVNDWKNALSKSSTKESDLSSASLTISLICPLGLDRMNIPVRSINCTHISCFDFITYLRFQSEYGSWKCPLCSHECTFDDLRLDDVTGTILKVAPPNAISAHVDESGKILSLEYEKEDISD